MILLKLDQALPEMGITLLGFVKFLKDRLLVFRIDFSEMLGISQL